MATRKRKSAFEAVHESQLRFAAMLHSLAFRIEQGNAMILRGEISEENPSHVSIEQGRLCVIPPADPGIIKVNLEIGSRK